MVLPVGFFIASVNKSDWSVSGIVLPQDRMLLPVGGTLENPRNTAGFGSAAAGIRPAMVPGMRNYRVSLRFSRLVDSGLKVFTTEVIEGMTGNPLFPTPLVPLAELASLQSAFGDAMTASDLGGRQTTAVKNQCRTELLSGLRRQASYVQGVCRHDETGILSSGFKVASQNRVQSPLPQPVILKILNERTETLVLRLTPITNARSYEVQLRVGEGDWQSGGIYQQARRLEVPNLTPGTRYDLRVRALGGSTGYSDWSGVTSAMSL